MRPRGRQQSTEIVRQKRRWRGGGQSWSHAAPRPAMRVMTALTFEFLRSQIVGIDSAFETPFGRRLMVYCDYTASGRCLLFVERYLQSLQRIYANTHTEDDLTGPQHEPPAARSRAHDQARRSTPGRTDASWRAARAQPARSTNCSRSSASRCRPPRARWWATSCAPSSATSSSRRSSRFQQREQPVVFVGPYEHHSNEVTWRQGLATVVEVNLAADGGVDLAHLETLLQEPEYQGRLRIGSFSAASNVTGMRSPVREIAQAAARTRCVRVLRLCRERALRRDRHESGAGRGGGDASIDAVFLRRTNFSAARVRAACWSSTSGCIHATCRRASAAAAPSIT